MKSFIALALILVTALSGNISVLANTFGFTNGVTVGTGSAPYGNIATYGFRIGIRNLEHIIPFNRFTSSGYKCYEEPERRVEGPDSSNFLAPVKPDAKSKKDLAEAYANSLWQRVSTNYVTCEPTSSFLVQTCITGTDYSSKKMMADGANGTVAPAGHAMGVSNSLSGVTRNSIASSMLNVGDKLTLFEDIQAKKYKKEELTYAKIKSILKKAGVTLDTKAMCRDSIVKMLSGDPDFLQERHDTWTGDKDASGLRDRFYNYLGALMTVCIAMGEDSNSQRAISSFVKLGLLLDDYDEKKPEVTYPVIVIESMSVMKDINDNIFWYTVPNFFCYITGLKLEYLTEAYKYLGNGKPNVGTSYQLNDYSADYLGKTNGGDEVGNGSRWKVLMYKIHEKYQSQCKCCMLSNHMGFPKGVAKDTYSVTWNCNADNWQDFLKYASGGGNYLMVSAQGIKGMMVATGKQPVSVTLPTVPELSFSWDISPNSVEKVDDSSELVDGTDLKADAKIIDLSFEQDKATIKAWKKDLADLDDNDEIYIRILQYRNVYFKDKTSKEATFDKLVAKKYHAPGKVEKEETATKVPMYLSVEGSRDVGVKSKYGEVGEDIPIKKKYFIEMLEGKKKFSIKTDSLYAKDFMNWNKKKNGAFVANTIRIWYKKYEEQNYTEIPDKAIKQEGDEIVNSVKIYGYTLGEPESLEIDVHYFYDGEYKKEQDDKATSSTGGKIKVGSEVDVPKKGKFGGKTYNYSHTYNGVDPDTEGKGIVSQPIKSANPDPIEVYYTSSPSDDSPGGGPTPEKTVVTYHYIYDDVEDPEKMYVETKPVPTTLTECEKKGKEGFKWKKTQVFIDHTDTKTKPDKECELDVEVKKSSSVDVYVFYEGGAEPDKGKVKIEYYYGEELNPDNTEEIDGIDPGETVTEYPPKPEEGYEWEYTTPPGDTEEDGKTKVEIPEGGGEFTVEVHYKKLPVTYTYDQIVKTPYAELKAGQVTDTGAVEPYEAMAGFPTTTDIYFASGGDEFVVQLSYQFRELQESFRTYTQDSNTATDSLRIDYKVQKGAQKSATPGSEPAPLKAKCPNCEATIETKWFAVRVEETHWDWTATATGSCTDPGDPPTTHSCSDTKSTSDSETPGPDAEAQGCNGVVATKAQEKVKATRWNWEWRNYGFANTYHKTDAETGMPYTFDKKNWPNTVTAGTTNTQNSKYTNEHPTISNCSLPGGSYTFRSTDKDGTMKHVTSWDQKIVNFNYAKIIDCKVWKLVRSKVDDTVLLTATDDITAEVQSVDDSYLFNAAATDTAKDGRFWHSLQPEDQDEFKFKSNFNPAGFCDHCVEYEAGKKVESENIDSTYDNPYCISDYLILRTSKADISMISFEYDAKNTDTTCIGKVKFTGSKKDGNYSIEIKDVDFTSQNNRATEEIVCEGQKSFTGALLTPDGMTFGGYNGMYTIPSAKYVSKLNGIQNITIDPLRINQPTFSKYVATQKPSPVFKLVKNMDVPDITVQNGAYFFGESDVFYKNMVDYFFEERVAPLYEIEPQERYGGEVGFVMNTTYSPNHDSINGVVVHNPVTSQYSTLIPLDPKRDQRTQSSLIEDPSKNNFPGECTHDASTCAYSKLVCSYTGTTYHTDECYDITKKEITLSPDLPTQSFDYTGMEKTVTLSPGNYTIEAYGGQGGNDLKAGGLGGKVSANILLTEDTTFVLQVAGKGNSGSSAKGGYGGGGKSGPVGSSGSGGGASTVKLEDGTVLMVAGGGGGGGANSVGGAGGGLIGGNASGGATGGTQATGGNGNLAGGKFKGGDKNQTATSTVYLWTHDSGCSYAGQTHESTTTTHCSYCTHNCGTYVAKPADSDGSGGGGGYYGGGASIGDNGGGGGSSYTEARLTDVKHEQGVQYGNGKIVIRPAAKRVTIEEKRLACEEIHHSPNSNFMYYVVGWNTEPNSMGEYDKVGAEGYDWSGTVGIAPAGTKTYYTKSQILTDMVLIKSGDVLELALRESPTVDLVTGREQAINTYTVDGITQIPCIWNLTDTDAPTIDTVASTAQCWHESFGNEICWVPCDNDENHKNTGTVTVDGQTLDRSGTFYNLDYGFQLYFPNIGNFYGNGAYGIGDISAIEGKGYTSPMDTTIWLKRKYVVFGFDVIYDKNGDGVFTDDRLYKAGEEVDLGFFTVNGVTGTFTDDQPATYIYNFYIPLEQNEAFSTTVSCYAVADNNPTNAWTDNPNSHNYIRNDFAACHDATKEHRVDLVGRIGSLTMIDTGDFRFANLFKETTDGWLVDNIVKTVDPNKQNFYMADKYTVRGELGTTATNGLNTYGTQTWKQDISKRLDFPLTPAKNNIGALQKQPQRIGYLNYMSVETIGNYYGENAEGDDSYKMQITPYYYHFDMNTGKWTPVDVYMLVGTEYERINAFDNPNPIAEHEWFYDLNWLGEQDRRMYTLMEKDTTDMVVETYKQFLDPLNPDSAIKRLLIPSGREWIYGTAQRLFLKDKNRTFIGTSLTESVDTNPGKRITEAEYARNGQRWHFHLGLPSSAVFVKAGEPCTQENIDLYANDHSVVVCAIDILVRGTQWTLKYDGPDLQDRYIQITPDGPKYPYGGNPDPGPTPPGPDPNPDTPSGPDPGDKIITTIISSNRSSRQDLNTSGTH